MEPLRSLESELDETVPATRSITVEDVLSFRLGFGSIMTPGRFPVTKAEQELGLKTLGMADTGFWVPVAKRDRFTTFYAPGAEGDGLRVLNSPDGWWSEPLKWPDASGALVSTADDLYRFASLVPAGEGSEDGEAGHPGDVGNSGVPGGFAWEGGSGTTWRTDTAKGLTGILLTQRMVMSPEPTQVVRDFWAAAYDAIDD